MPALPPPPQLPLFSGSLWRRTGRWSFIALATYICLILSLVVPVVQKHFIYLHFINFPFFADFATPEKYGLAPSKTRNLRLEGVDGNFIGAWHVLPDAVYRSQVPSLIPTTSISGNDSAEADTEVIKSGAGAAVYERAICTHPVVIYLHGNAANRAAPFRVAAYAQLSSRLQANVLAIDYRGFGDSQGTPSEMGLVADARLAWDWVQRMRQACETRDPGQEVQATEEGERGGSDAPAKLPGRDVLIMGQSLGTGPATALTVQLAREGTPPQGLVLLAPYRSLSQLAAGFRVGGLLPILLPALYLIPFAQRGLERALRTRFDSEAALAGLVTAVQEGRSRRNETAAATAEPTVQELGRRDRQPSSWPHVVISHAINDEVIPYSHGEAIFDKMLKTELKLRHSIPSTNPRSTPSNGNTGSIAGVEGHEDDLATTKYTTGDHTTEPGTAKLGIQEIRLSWASVHRFFLRSLATQKQRADQPFSDSTNGGSAESLCPSVTLLLPALGGHNTVSEGIVDFIGELTQMRGNAHVEQAEKPWLPAVRRDTQLSYASQ